MSMFKKKKNHDRCDAFAGIVYAVNEHQAYEKAMQAIKPKKKFNINEYPGRYVMYCENKEELFKFYDYLHKVCRKLCSGRDYAEAKVTIDCIGGDVKYVYFNEGLYGSYISEYIANTYKVLKFKDFDWSDFDMKETKRFYMGDKVKLRGKDVEGVIVGTYTPGSADVPAKYTIKNTKNGLRSTHYFCELELVESKQFTKEDLKPGMVVEVRDGARYLFVNEIFVSSGGYLQFISYNDDLTHARYGSLDVVKIFDTRGTEFGNILHDHHIDLIWERKDDVKEMTVAEIEKKLGYKVKVIADKE